MTREQVEILRHALGLNYKNTSFRKHYVAASDDPACNEMVANGLLKKSHNALLPEDHGVFYVTMKGALAVLKRNERLCPEDFPHDQYSVGVLAQAGQATKK